MRSARRIGLAESAPVVKLALLADCATQQLALLLKALLAAAGLRAEIYEGAFNAIEIECSDPSSGLYRFSPDAVIILNSAQALRAAHAGRRDQAAGFVADCLTRILDVWQAIHGNCQAPILQSTFAVPLESCFGNYELRVATSLRSTVRALNAALTEASRGGHGVWIHDVENVASWAGRSEFFDERAWDLWKIPCALQHLPRIAKNIVDVLLALRGQVVKCVVTDLDNTLWGGVIGDDGLEGIVLGAHAGSEGESFVRLQMYLRQLRDRGILLAVCSKNDEGTALLPFLQHPDMVLKREDISVFVANWEDKAAGIGRIREALGIGFDSMVFLDDNAFERNLVRELLPEVIVPELPPDPSQFVAVLADLNLFETTTLSSEDLQRAGKYRQEAQRRESAAHATSVDDYLRSLDMQAVVSRFDSFHLPRIAQLMQRSNQFNLCTRRLTEAQCGALAQADTFVPLYMTLADKFGDHGLIAVVVLEKARGELKIRDWLMSCRVLARGVEQFLMNHVMALAAQLGARRVLGEYVPTAKNALVRDFFPQFGFARVPTTANLWMLDVAAYEVRTNFIRLVQTSVVQGDEAT
jgi:FkbH-like protein